MSGCTRRQHFWQVEVPTALPQILVGFNQTTMAALSMVIVAAIIGGFEDIGWEVLSSMRKAEFGQSILSGAVIALLAILIDRMTIGFARNKAAIAALPGWLRGRNFALSLLAAVAGRRRHPLRIGRPEPCCRPSACAMSRGSTMAARLWSRAMPILSRASRTRSSIASCCRCGSACSAP